MENFGRRRKGWGTLYRGVITGKKERSIGAVVGQDTCMPRAKTVGKQVSFKVTPSDLDIATRLFEQLRQQPDMEQLGISQTSIFRMAMARGLKEMEIEYLKKKK